MKYFSMFSGIGGFELGIERAYNNKHEPEKSRQTDSEGRRVGTTNEQRNCLCITDNAPLCIGFSEIDKYAIATYKHHFPNHRNYGDSTKINAGELPDFDLLCGGFPCQAFSIAGKRLGFKDTRGTLFFDIARIIKAKKPKIVWLENVKGLLSHDNGRTFAVILATLDELGYNAEWQVLNSKHYGVPQNRERVFIIGHLREGSGRQVFPFREISQKFNEEQRRGMEIQAAQCITNRVYKMGRDDNYIRYPLKFPNKNKQNINGDYAFTVDSANTGGIKKGDKIRRLTPTECERLQGFPDGWTLGSDTQRYKQCGNAVTVNVIEAIAKELF